MRTRIPPAVSSLCAFSFPPPQLWPMHAVVLAPGNYDYDLIIIG